MRDNSFECAWLDKCIYTLYKIERYSILVCTRIAKVAIQAQIELDSYNYDRWIAPEKAIEAMRPYFVVIFKKEK